MSRLQGKPYAQKVVESLDATERANLLGLLNGSSVVPAFRSLTNATAYITDADEGVSHVSLETADGNLTGYLAYTDEYVTLFAYERNSQGIAQYEIDLDAMTISEVQENLDIEGLRTIVTDSLKADLVGGKVPAEQLPSYVDDVVEYEDLAHFPAEGEYGKIYIALDTGSTYRWGGTEYVQIGGSSATPMISITWSELKTLRDAGELLPGQQYRITDYACTALGDGITVGGNVFDIIVTAEDESHLEEEAFATHHAGDTYFANSRLEAWRIWYALDNDTDRFAWADNTNGKGVIYRMIDEFGNDVPYDFKNCLFGSYYTFSAYADNAYFDASLAMTSGISVRENVIGEWMYDGKRRLNGNYFYNTSNTLSVYENTFGINCHDNVSKSVFARNRFADGCASNTFGSSCFDNSLNTTCQRNTFADSCQYNVFGSECNDNTFGKNFKNNTFGNECHNNVFGTSCTNNTLESGCYSNTFSNQCTFNILGAGSYSNIFNGSTQSNELGPRCHGNTISSAYNSLGQNCENIKITATNCNDNAIGDFCSSIQITAMGCGHNIFGKYCQSIKLEYQNIKFNVFGENCSYIYMNQNCQYNTFGSRCTEIRTGTEMDGCTFGTECQNVWFGAASNTLINYVKYVTVDNGVSFVRITSADDANASDSNYLQNIHVHSGIKGTDASTPVSIVVPERGQAYSYDYYATNSVDVMI